MKQPLTTLLIGVAMAASITVATPAWAVEGPSLEPASVEAIVFPGQSVEIEKSVYTPLIPPDPEIYFLVDTTGSMSSVIAEVQLEIEDVINDVLAVQPTALFGLGQYKDFNDFDPFVYQHMVDIGDDVVGSIGSLVAGGGDDGSEGQFYALDQIANTPIAGFSGDDGSTPIIVWVGDAPGHDPVCAAINSLGYDITEASVTADLVAAGYTVVALSTTTGYPNGLDDDPTSSVYNYTAFCEVGGTAGQATRITAATGGTALANVGPGEVTDAILNALSAVEIEVAMTSDCEYPIVTDFDPAYLATESGEVVEFLETISVASNAPGGVYECRDWATIDGEPMVDDTGAIIYETKTILVPENYVTGGGHVTEGKGKNKIDLLTHGGNAGYLSDGSLVGHWNFNLEGFKDLGWLDDNIRVQTTEITGLQFFDTGLDPAPPYADADTAEMTADARVRVGNEAWMDDCTLLAIFVDGGEPEEDAIDISASCPSSGWGILGFEVTGGNIQIHDGTKD